MVDTQTRATAPSPGPLLEATALSKHFTGTLALDAIDFDLRRGEVHALLGQNGAGKSTLIKILAGVYSPDAGEIRFDDRPVPAWRGRPADKLHPSGPRPRRLDDGRRERRRADAAIPGLASA